jgi:hypothetical protein
MMITRRRTSRASSTPQRTPRNASRPLWRFSLLTGLTALTLLHAKPGYASSATPPSTTSPTPAPSRVATGSPSAPSPSVPSPFATPARTATTASASQPAKPTPALLTERLAPPPPPAEELDAEPVATAVAPHPRAFRTPERAAPPAFVAPQATPPPAPDEPLHEAPAAGMPASPSTSALVVFRATARTALEGFDLRVTYPRALGSFAGHGHPAECNAGTGAAVTANDRGDGQLILLVASARTLPFPLDVFCGFTLAPGASLDAGAFAVRVAEVTSDTQRADPSLLIVNVVVR